MSSADSWIAEVFEPSLTGGRLLDAAVCTRLVGGVDALRKAGLLEPDHADRLLRRLDEAQRAQHDTARARLSEARPLEPHPTNLLRGVMVPMAPLVDVDGITLVLVTVEVWEQDVHLQAVCLQTQQTEELDAGRRQQLDAWGERHRQARDGGLPRLGPPPDEPSVRRLGHVVLALRDDLGTPYAPRGRSMGGSSTEWRLAQQCQPGIPAQATTLSIDVQDSDGATIHTVELDMREDLLRAANP